MGAHIPHNNNDHADDASTSNNNNNNHRRRFFVVRFQSPAILKKNNRRKKMLFVYQCWFMMIIGLLVLVNLFQNRPETLQQGINVMKNTTTILMSTTTTSLLNNIPTHTSTTPPIVDVVTTTSPMKNINEDDVFIMHHYNSSTFPSHIQDYIQQMIDKNLTKSAGHMIKLWHHKDNLSKLDPSITFRASTQSGGGVRLSGDYSYLHIWKSGGTTMRKQVQNGGELTVKKLQSHPNNKFVTFVRDPIDHFLSGWSECQLRWNKNDVNRARQRSELLDSDPTIYNMYIQKYLNSTKHWSQSGYTTCYTHSLPQINFMLSLSSSSSNNNNNNKDDGLTMTNNFLHPHIHIVGDMSEIRGVLSIINFTYNESIEIGRNATNNPFKRIYFRTRRDQLSQQTIMGICNFVALDYYLLDYELPRECRYDNDIPSTSSYNNTKSLLHILNMTERTYNIT